MAKTGSISISYTQNITNNQSTITVTGRITTSGESYRGSHRTGTYTIKNGNTTIASGSFTCGAPANSTTTLFTKTITVNHNADGSYGTVTASYNYDSGWCSASSSTAIPTIPRASSFGTISGNTIGSNITVNINRNSSSFTHSLWYSFGGLTWQGINSGIGTSQTFTPPLSICSQIPNATSGTMTLILRTYNGSAQVGNDVYKNITVYVPSSVIPSAPSISVSEAVSGLAAQFGGYVKGKSQLRVTLSASGSYSSSIRSYTTSINGNTYYSSSFVSNVINTAGSVVISSTVTDSRNRTNNNSTSINVYDYSAPKINRFDVIRCNSDGSANEEGTYLKFTSSVEIASVNNKNTKSCKIQYLNGSTWTDLTTISMSSYSFNDNEYRSTVVFNADTSYRVRLYVADYFTSVTSEKTVSSTPTLINFHTKGNGLAIGKTSETEKLFEVQYPTRFNDKIDSTVIRHTDEHYVMKTVAGGGIDGYFKFATFVISGSYINTPVKISVLSRDRSVGADLFIYFSSTSSTDPDLADFSYYSTTDFYFYIHKSSTSTWDLYYEKTQAWGSFKVVDYQTGDASAIRVTWLHGDSDYVTSIPSDYYAAYNALSHKYLPTSGGTITGGLGLPYIELSAPTPYIDFHHNNSTGDYTHRLITTDNFLKLEGKGLHVAGGSLAAQYQTNMLGYFRFQQEWMGCYPSYSDALNNTNRKGWIGHDGSAEMRMQNEAGNILCLTANGISIVAELAGASSSSNSFRMGAGVTDKVLLGTPTTRWLQVYAKNTGISTSDRNKKKNFKQLDDLYYKLAEKIEIISYQFKDTEQSDNIGRTHIGSIAQQVEEAMKELGMTSKDFAGFCKDVKQKVEVDENGTETFTPIEGEYEYSLRYDEIEMLKLWYLEETNRRQQKQINELEDKVAKLEGLVQQLLDKGAQ